ncbi:MAG: methionine biosynthesis protein MetW [Spirochaetales bacterium]|nr:methionine biosynthesis protein MetW [Spirochaetales bacterium]
MKIIKSTVINYISDEIPQGARVLDLGCGSGDLLWYLMRNKNITGYGVDIDTQAIINCIGKGISAIQFDLENMPMEFANKSFDMVIFNQTIQQIHNVDALISEMLRIGKEGLLGFTNFGYMPTRTQLFLKGRMPENDDLPFSWHDTPNVHYLTVLDFRQYCKEHNILINKEIYLRRRRNRKSYKQVKFLPNMRAELAFYRIARADS